jgi:putative aminopeptidase FrvX
MMTFDYNLEGPMYTPSLRVDLLSKIMAIPTYSRSEDQMVAFLVDYVHGHGLARCGVVTTDKWKNVYIRKGKAGHVPCVAAHIDTVHPLGRVNIVTDNEILFGTDDKGNRTGIGGDDKAGVYICLELLERFDDIAVVLFAGEEIGMEGANNAPAAWFADVGYVIEFDCPGQGLLSYTSGGSRLFANDGEFIRTAMPVLKAHGLTHWQRHPYTDVKAVQSRFGVSCLNISSGYHNWHRRDEYVVLKEVQAGLDAGQALITALGRRSYPFRPYEADSAEPLCKLTDLKIN